MQLSSPAQSHSMYSTASLWWLLMASCRILQNTAFPFFDLDFCLLLRPSVFQIFLQFCMVYYVYINFILYFVRGEPVHQKTADISLSIFAKNVNIDLVLALTRYLLCLGTKLYIYIHIYIYTYTVYIGVKPTYKICLLNI